MSNYRRCYTPGACYFFTVVTLRRRPIFNDAHAQQTLRAAIVKTRERYPFEINAWMLLPDHLHCIWTLPEGDSNHSVRWNLIKTNFSREMRHLYLNNEQSASRLKHRDGGVWQRRYWEHRIRDEKDYQNHVDYIHYNPVKHGLVEVVVDWPYSTFHRDLKAGVYPVGWAGRGVDESGEFGE
jgi:putative transposase